MVERELPGITMEQLAGAQRAAIAISQRFTEEGKPVRYIRSTYVPGAAHCMCLFGVKEATLTPGAIGMDVVRLNAL